MAGILEQIRNRFSSVQPLKAGMHQFVAAAGTENPIRLHLRLEADGTGVLIVNAKTVLHLNSTASEYAFLWSKDTPPEKAGAVIASRYRIGRKQAMHDYLDFVERVTALTHSIDLDPVTYMGFDRKEPYAHELSAPYRIDCALTYSLPAGESKQYAPVERVKQELTTEEWKSILHSAWAAGIPHVVFTGGEPTLRDDLPALISEAETIGQVSGVLSGGEKLADPAYMKSLLDTGLDHLMYLLRPDQESSWTAVKNAMDANLFVTVHVTMNEATVGKEEAILSRLKGLGVQSISLSAGDAIGRTALPKIVARTAESGFTLAWDLPVPYSSAHPIALEAETPSSGAGKGWLYVEPDGDVLPEQGVNRVLGNMLKDTWPTIWAKAKQ